MRAVVMEIHDRDIIVLTKDGDFRKIKRPSSYVEVGMEINVNDVIDINLRRIAAIIVIVFLISGLGVSTYAYYTPYGYINVDINPSIEIVYNRFNRILEVKGVNEDGEDIANSISDYKNKKVETIVGDIIDKTVLDNNDQVNVVLTYDKLEDKTIDNVKQSLEEDSNVNVYTVEVSGNSYKQVKDNNESPGKSALIQEVRKSTPIYEKEELEQKTIDELIEIIEEKQQQKENKKDKKNNKNEKNKHGKKSTKTKINRINNRINNKGKEIEKEVQKSFKNITNDNNEDNKYKDNNKNSKRNNKKRIEDNNDKDSKDSKKYDARDKENKDHKDEDIEGKRDNKKDDEKVKRGDKNKDKREKDKTEKKIRETRIKDNRH